MFFTPERSHLFRPLIGKYREQVAACLRELYRRIYGSWGEERQIHDREHLIAAFQEALARAPVLDETPEEGRQAPRRNEREQAGWILNQLLDHGWLERLVDEATLQSSYGFTRAGRRFSQAMTETAGGRFRTRHRNTRNTRNALQAFLESGEVYDLLDGFEYSERIVSDFSDVISELDERKRQLVHAVESQRQTQRASDEFFDYMEKRFMPDIAVRLSADSVEKYRDEIQDLVNRARRKRKDFKAKAEGDLRTAAPELIGDPRQSLYLTILDRIEGRLHGACTVMLPALRDALNGLTRRADIIIRQLSYGGARQNRLRELCAQLRQQPAAQDAALRAAGDALASFNLALPDPDSLRLRSGEPRREVETRLEAQAEPDPATRRELFLQQALELAFSVNNRALREYLAAAVGRNGRVRTDQLPVQDARDLLMSAHAIEAAGQADPSNAFLFEVTPLNQQLRSEHFHTADGFEIRLVARHQKP